MNRFLVIFIVGFSLLSLSFIIDSAYAHIGSGGVTIYETTVTLVDITVPNAGFFGGEYWIGVSGKFEEHVGKHPLNLGHTILGITTKPGDRISIPSEKSLIQKHQFCDSPELVINVRTWEVDSFPWRDFDKIEETYETLDYWDENKAAAGGPGSVAYEVQFHNKQKTGTEVVATFDVYTEVIKRHAGGKCNPPSTTTGSPEPDLFDLLKTGEIGNSTKQKTLPRHPTEHDFKIVNPTDDSIKVFSILDSEQIIFPESLQEQVELVPKSWFSSSIPDDGLLIMPDSEMDVSFSFLPPEGTPPNDYHYAILLMDEENNALEGTSGIIQVVENLVETLDTSMNLDLESFFELVLISEIGIETIEQQKMTNSLLFGILAGILVIIGLTIVIILKKR